MQCGYSLGFEELDEDKLKKIKGDKKMDSEKMLDNTYMGKFYVKLADIQRNLKAPKNQTNKFGGYKYRSCSDILESIKPLLNGLILTLSDDLVFEPDNTRYIKATAEITDGINTKSVSAYAREAIDKKGMDASQMTGAASSYARKYALSGLFDLDDTNDADTNEYADNTGEVSVNPIKPNGNGVAAQTNVVKKIYTGQAIRLNTLPKEQENCFDPAEYM